MAAARTDRPGCRLPSAAAAIASRRTAAARIATRVARPLSDTYSRTALRRQPCGGDKARAAPHRVVPLRRERLHVRRGRAGERTDEARSFEYGA
mmetsp:Transcript_26338/g.84374  ORF Transcript_26338/g.84374 Transcript_26338/m.84374 type:complete len:94 (+) Transcript_26338:333-614(+)